MQSESQPSESSGETVSPPYHDTLQLLPDAAVQGHDHRAMGADSLCVSPQGAGLRVSKTKPPALPGGPGVTENRWQTCVPSRHPRPEVLIIRAAAAPLGWLCAGSARGEQQDPRGALVGGGHVGQGEQEAEEEGGSSGCERGSARMEEVHLGLASQCTRAT